MVTFLRNVLAYITSYRMYLPFMWNYFYVSHLLYLDGYNPYQLLSIILLIIAHFGNCCLTAQYHYFSGEL